jgi:hypothetical protein
MSDSFDLERFVDAQASIYRQAVDPMIATIGTMKLYAATGGEFRSDRNRPIGGTEAEAGRMKSLSHRCASRQ